MGRSCFITSTTCVGRKTPLLSRSLTLSLSHSYGVTMENLFFFSGSTIADTSTWLGNARPTGGEREAERRGSRVRLSVRLSVFLSPTRCSLAPTSWFPLPHYFSLSLSLVCPSFQDLSIPLSFSLFFSFYHFVSVSLTVPLSPFHSLFRSFFPPFPPPSVAPGLLLSLYLFRSVFARTPCTPFFLSFCLSTASSLSRKSQVRRCSE